LKVGLLHETPYAEMKDYRDFPAPNKMFDPQEGHRLYLEYIEELVLAEELGFDYVALPEQHSKQDNIDPSPNIIISHLVGKTKRIGLLPYGAILPLHNPIRIAEEYAMLDVLSKGRLMAGFVHGGLTNYLAYGMDYLSERNRFEEAWDLIVKAWTADEPFQWKGKHYQFEKVSVWPRPYQKPHPQLHTSGPFPAFAAERDASYGLWVQPTADIRGTFGKYRDAYVKAHKKEPTQDKVVLVRSVYVSENDDRAEEECAKHLLYMYRTLWKPGMMAVKQVEERIGRKLFWASRLFLTEMSYDQLLESGMHIAGSPESVLEQIMKQQKEIGFGTFVSEFRFGSLPHRSAKKSMELFAKKVMPHLREGTRVPLIKAR